MYKIKFNEVELNALNAIESDKVRNSTMSIYSYFKKLLQENNGTLDISYRKFLKRYVRYHGSMSVQTFKYRVDSLVDLGLLKISKEGKKHIYELDNKLYKKLDNENQAPDTDTSSLEMDSDLHKCLNPKTNDIYTNTTAEYGEVITSEEEAVAITGQAIKTLKVKSKWVINAAIETIKQCYRKIHRLGAFKYISKVILKLQAISKSVYKNTHVYNAAVKQYRSNNKTNRFNSFTQRERSQEEWKDLEHRLLGWEK